MSDRMTKWKEASLWLALLLYLDGRVLQLFADRLPTLLIVIMHVVPPALFAVIHASVIYRIRGMLIFALTCVLVAGTSETLSLRSGIPFGHYNFTEVMGPKFFDLPPLLVLAYLGIGYCSWILAVLILRQHRRPIRGIWTIAVSALASFVMMVWDVSMEADWSTVDKAWLWRGGGPYFGVPISNFVGWYLTAFIFYQIFAVYGGRKLPDGDSLPVRFWRIPVLMYAICALGNVLILKLPMAPPVVTDPSGRRWSTTGILLADSVVSLALMLPLCITAWARTETTAKSENQGQAPGCSVSG
jgi:putative membrane protein